MRRLKILHRTYYNFCSLVQLQPHRLLLRPREGPGLRVEVSSLDISPPAQIRWHRDANDNSVAMATFAVPTSQLAIISECIVQQFDERPLDFLVADFAVNSLKPKYHWRNCSSYTKRAPEWASYTTPASQLRARCRRPTRSGLPRGQRLGRSAGPAAGAGTAS